MNRQLTHRLAALEQGTQAHLQVFANAYHDGVLTLDEMRQVAPTIADAIFRMPWRELAPNHRQQEMKRYAQAVRRGEITRTDVRTIAPSVADEILGLLEN